MTSVVRGIYVITSRTCYHVSLYFLPSKIVLHYLHFHFQYELVFGIMEVVGII